jgi:hypothetical protein
VPPGRRRDTSTPAPAPSRRGPLGTLARLVADRGDHAQAARLTGAVDAARRRIGYPRPPADLSADASLRDDLAAVLGKTTIADLVGEGSDLGLDRAVVYASRGRGRRGRPAIGWNSLTTTEREVGALVAEGLTNPPIADEFELAPSGAANRSAVANDPW